MTTQSNNFYNSPTRSHAKRGSPDNRSVEVVLQEPDSPTSAFDVTCIHVEESSAADTSLKMRMQPYVCVAISYSEDTEENLLGEDLLGEDLLGLQYLPEE